MGERPVSEMTDRELLEEMAENSRQVRDVVTKLVGDFERSPLAGMLKSGASPLSLLMGKR